MVEAKQYRQDAFGSFLYVQELRADGMCVVVYPDGQKRAYSPATVEQAYPTVCSRPQRHEYA